MKDIIIIGAGGFGLEIIDLIEQINQQKKTYNILGFLDDKKTGEIINEIKVLGTTEDILKYKNINVIIAIANPLVREKYYNYLKQNGFTIPNLIHPKVILSNYIELKSNIGAIINANSIISAKATIGEGVIIDSSVYIGHETKLDNFVTIYSGAMVAGNVIIEKGTQIGLGVNVIQGNKIGKNSFIGAGSTVISNIANNVIAVGTPCKVIGENI